MASPKKLEPVYSLPKPSPPEDEDGPSLRIPKVEKKNVLTFTMEELDKPEMTALEMLESHHSRWQVE